MIQQVYKTLPDDEPILSICVVEDPAKCPAGYYVVNRTHDQDSDADLYRQSALFGKRNTRYLCLSKIHGIADLVVEAVSIMGEKDPPPASYCLIAKTKDSDQKAWRKSQLCYKVAKRSLTTSCVTDVILLSRMKKAPEGFELGGEINGLTLCYKVGNNYPDLPIISKAGLKPPTPHLAYSLNPKGLPSNVNSNVLNAPIPAPRRAPAEKPPSHVNGYQNVILDDDSPHEYEKLVISPKRPAPLPPVSSGPVPTRPAPKLPSAMSTYATLGAFQGLEGIPFVLHSKLQFNSASVEVPSLKFKSAYEIEKEFNYDFRVERQT